MPRRRRGFTLIEMLAVAIIIGILALIAIPAIINARETAAKSACAANRKLIITAINNYKVRTGTAINSTSSWSTLSTKLSTDGYLTPVPTCATKTGTQYTLTFTDIKDGAAQGQADACKVEVACPGDHSADETAALL